jgi:hypothetical protein
MIDQGGLAAAQVATDQRDGYRLRFHWLQTPGRPEPCPKPECL